MVPVHFYAENTPHGTLSEVVKQEFNGLNTNASKSIQKGVCDCYAYLLSLSKQSSHAALFAPLTKSALHHYVDGVGGHTAVLYGVGDAGSGAMAMIVAFKFAATLSAQVANADIQTALARFHLHPGKSWL